MATLLGGAGTGSQVFQMLPDESKKAPTSTGISKPVVFTLCLIALVEGMDLVLIGATSWVWFEAPPIGVVGWSFQMNGYLATVQGIFQNAGAAFWGIAADRGYLNRKWILVYAAAAQALCTMALGYVETIPPMWFIRALNGFFLAALRPISNGLVADLVPEKDQGYYFGLMQGLWSLGLSATGMIVSPIAPDMLTIPVLGQVVGWRVAFYVIAMAAVLASILAALVMPEVPSAPLTEEQKAQSPAEGAKHEIKTMLTFLRYPSFVLMICQGIFGSIPWLVMGNLQMFMLLGGLTKEQTIPVSAMGLFGVVGGFLGGVISDALTKVIGPRGRPATAMATVALGVPLMYTLYWGLAPWYTPEYFTVLNICIIMAAFNVLANWAQPGCNFPILSQIVTAKDRNKVICWEMAFENTMANILGNNAPAFVIWYLSLPPIDVDPFNPKNLDMAESLGLAQVFTICTPWVICFFIYSGLLWSFPVDLKRVQQEKEIEGSLTEMS